jgi:dynein assembly factor 2
MPSSSSSRPDDDIQLTADEAQKLDTAFNSEEFRKLMTDYVTSLSDPRNREEQEACISEMEANEELPTGKSLIHPNAGFVVKCHKVVRGNDDKPSKIFANIVYSDKILRPSPSSDEKTSDKTSYNAKKKWLVPYAIGPVRMEYDKSNILVPTYDVCFHPLSLQYAHGRKEFRDLVISIAIDAMVDAFSRSGEIITINSNYAILKNVRYKSGNPKTLIVGEK